MRRTSTANPSVPVSNQDTGPRSAEHGPEHEPHADHERGADQHVVDRAAHVSPLRIESHPLSIAARWQRSRAHLICCSAVSPRDPDLGARTPRSSSPHGRRHVWAVVLVAALVTVVAACASDPELAKGWQVYNDRCASCHGAKGGGGAGPKLAGTVVADFPNIGDQITIIENGKGGGAMPAWKDTLSSSEIEAVAKYTRECLGKDTC